MQPAAEHERPRTALVAGGTGALGSAVVELLLERGERVCVPWIVSGEAERMRAAHAGAVDDGRLRLSECNAADPDQLASLLDVLQADWGPLWLAGSLVGGWAGGANVADVDDVTLLDRMVTLNLRSAFVVAREGLRHMGDQGGRVVLAGSATVWRPAAGQAAYTAAKAGVASLVQPSPWSCAARAAPPTRSCPRSSTRRRTAARCPTPTTAAGPRRATSPT